MSFHYIVKQIDKKDYVSSNKLTVAEVAQAIGFRTSQIERGAPVFTDVTGITNARKKAIKEFFDRKSPLILTRIIKIEGNIKWVEKFRVRDMKFPVKSNIY